MSDLVCCRAAERLSAFWCTSMQDTPQGQINQYHRRGDARVPPACVPRLPSLLQRWLLFRSVCNMGAGQGLDASSKCDRLPGLRCIHHWRCRSGLRCGSEKGSATEQRKTDCRMKYGVLPTVDRTGTPLSTNHFTAACRKHICRTG